MENKPTRYYSKIQETNVAKALGGCVNPNSGAGHWSKSDVTIKEAGMSIECKTSMNPRTSMSIKKEWLVKNKKEALSNKLYNSAVAISFEPEGSNNYYIINENLMKFLVEKLIEDFQG